MIDGATDASGWRGGCAWNGGKCVERAKSVLGERGRELQAKIKMLKTRVLILVCKRKVCM